MRNTGAGGAEYAYDRSHGDGARSMKYGYLLAAPVAVAVLGAGFLALAAETPQASRAETFRQLELFGDVMSRVQSDYVSEVDDGELIEAAINGMLQSLDPHSNYMPPDAFRDMQVTTRGEYGGLGLEVTMEDGFVKVVSPMDDTPASRAGIRSGDFITSIDGDPILGLSLDDAVDKMRGQPGQEITVTIAREGEEVFDVTLVREVIRVRPVTWRVEDGDIGYIRVATFSEQTTDVLEDAIRALKTELGENLTGVVLDLRDNPGGLLEQAVSVSDAFLDGGAVVSTRGRDAREIDVYNARPGDLLDGASIVVLINEGSASAAEIVAGAIQDRKRGVVLGRTSFGKGSVQTVIPIRGGRDGALRLTTATYYTPSGRSIQSTGIAPDIHVAFRQLSETAGPAGRRLSEADLPNAIANENGATREVEADDIDQPPDDFPEGDDYQLKRAIDVLHGNLVTTALGPRPG
jgi:carboxyl-terminal processing protease